MRHSITDGRRGTDATVLLCLLLAGVVVARVALAPGWAGGAGTIAATVFIAICVQASPYVVLGVLVAAAVRRLRARRAVRWAAARPRLSVPVAAVAGAALPGCECASVAVARSLLTRGLPPGAAVAFMSAAPAINPIAVLSTVAAFPGRPWLVAARVTASLTLASLLGCAGRLTGRPDARPRPTHGRIEQPHGPDDHAGDDHAGDDPDSTRVSGADGGPIHAVAGELARSLGLLCLGAAGAALLRCAVPHPWLDRYAGGGTLGVLVVAGLAVVLAGCSTSDAFVASSLTAASPAAQLVFMLVGPVVGVKVLTLHVGAFGLRFTWRFGCTAFVLAVVIALGFGRVW